VKPTAATKEWRAIAQGSDPLYDIAAVPGKRGKWTTDDFYALGVADWAEFRRHWEHYSPGGISGTCLEIGCGAGRMTTALAPDFDRVIALDVSEDMLAKAAAVVPENVELRQTDGRAFPVDADSVNAVFSVHVIQHLETRDDVVAYIREVRRVLAPGGSLLIHVIHKGARRGMRQRIKSELELQRSRLALKLGRSHTTMRVRDYWLDDVYTMFLDAGFVDLELRMITTSNYGHQCWLAKAPAS
jgi:ubiquinone/menaquinone biosynthesis C-methylase UbiE